MKSETKLKIAYAVGAGLIHGLGSLWVASAEEKQKQIQKCNCKHEKEEK